MTQTPKLKRNEALVLDALREEAGPQSAYQLLERLRGEGLKAPLQVYRALRTLCDRHLVHRLESRNAFVACAHGHDHSGHAVIFMLCEACGRVVEMSDGAVDRRLRTLAEESGFRLSLATTEMRGLCRDCAAA